MNTTTRTLTSLSLVVAAGVGGWAYTASGTSPQVTTLASASLSASASPTAVASDESGPATGRPQFRLDDTDARRTAIQVAYNECLLANGAKEMTAREEAMPVPAPGEDADGNPVGPLVADPVPAAASAACLTKLPLMPPEVEASSNPNFQAQSLAYVACMREGGLHVELLNKHNLDWTYSAGYPVPNDEDRIDHSCLLSSFS